MYNDILYSEELTGQEDFYDKYLPLVNNDLTMEDIQNNNNDGQIGDLLIEFKLSINDVNRVLFQTIKYLSALRIKGNPVPNNILLVSLNTGKSYWFKSEPYLKDIEKVYIGAASKNNKGFTGKDPIQKFDYFNNQLDEANMIKLMKDANSRNEKYKQEWLPVHIDTTDIVGWATTYYRINKNATKASFIGDSKNLMGEIRYPNHLKGMIIPYKGTNNDEFGYIMDRLNDDIQKKDLGAFFTPPLYAQKSNELVYDAIRRFQKSGNSDYIILDRCAGTGNLELSLNDNVPSDIQDKDVLSHVILNTYEYYEYKVLMERLGDKVRYINPPYTTFTDGTVAGSNALSDDFINNKVINKYINNNDCTNIIYENPPFAETTSMTHQKTGKGKSSGAWKKLPVTIDAKEELQGAQSNDMSNVFIWSAFNKYMKQSTDSVVCFSPIKYWKKSENWMDYAFEKGFIFNRRYFHTKSDTAVTCILWKNQRSNADRFNLSVFDIDTKNNELVDPQKEITVKRTHSLFSQKYYEPATDLINDFYKRNNINNHKDYDTIRKYGIYCDKNGTLLGNKNIRVSTAMYDTYIAYLVAQSSTFETPRSSTLLLRSTVYNGNGFYLTPNNYMYELPIFAAGWWATYNPKSKWYLNGIIYRSGDGKERYDKDYKSGELNKWLNQVLFYTCMEYYTKIRSIYGSDNRWYYNELCLDDNKGTVNDSKDKSNPKTLASKQLNTFLQNLDSEEQKMYDLWNRILKEAKETEKYNSDYNYGIFQIKNELDTKHKEVTKNGRKINIYDYPELHGDLRTMRKLVKQYYHTHIQDNLFKYDFLK